MRCCAAETLKASNLPPCDAEGFTWLLFQKRTTRVRVKFESRFDPPEAELQLSELCELLAKGTCRPEVKLVQSRKLAVGLLRDAKETMRRKPVASLTHFAVLAKPVGLPCTYALGVIGCAMVSPSECSMPLSECLEIPHLLRKK